MQPRPCRFGDSARPWEFVVPVVLVVRYIWSLKIAFAAWESDYRVSGCVGKRVEYAWGAFLSTDAKKWWGARYFDDFWASFVIGII